MGDGIVQRATRGPQRLRCTGVKMTSELLMQHAKRLVETAPLGSPYVRSVVKRVKAIADLITPRWIQNFMCANRIVLRSQTGKLMVSPLKNGAY